MFKGMFLVWSEAKEWWTSRIMKLTLKRTIRARVRLNWGDLVEATGSMIQMLNNSSLSWASHARLSWVSLPIKKYEKVVLVNCKTPYGCWNYYCYGYLAFVFFLQVQRKESSVPGLYSHPAPSSCHQLSPSRGSNKEGEGCFWHGHPSDYTGLKPLLHSLLELRYWEVTWLLGASVSSSSNLLPHGLLWEPHATMCVILLTAKRLGWVATLGESSLHFLRCTG